MGSVAGYKEYARVVEQMCEHLFCELTPSAGRRIANVVLATCHVDNYVDSAKGNVKKEREKKILDYLEHGDHHIFGDGHPELVAELIQLKKTLGDISPVRRAQFKKDVAEIFKCGDVLCSTKNTRSFIRARLEEGRRSADLVVLAVDELYDHPHSANFYRRLVAVHNLLDTLKDFKTDKENGEINLPVSGMFRIAASSCARLGAMAVTVSPPQRNILAGHLKAYLFRLIKKNQK